MATHLSCDCKCEFSNAIFNQINNGIINHANVNVKVIVHAKWIIIGIVAHVSFFSIRILFHGHWRLTWQHGKGGDRLLFHSTTSTCSQTFRHLFATLHVRWLSHIFIRTACIYQTASRRDLPPYRITIKLIGVVTFSFCLFTWWFDSSFLSILALQVIKKYCWYFSDKVWWNYNCYGDVMCQ